LRSYVFVEEQAKMEAIEDVVMEIPIQSGTIKTVTKCLASDYDLIKCHKWHFTLGYAKTQANGTSLGMHRLIMGVTNPRMVVDHINHDKLDNRRSNLRVVTRGANNQNKSKIVTESSTSKFKGVYKRTFSHKSLYLASCGNFYTESFESEEDAARAYDKAALHYCGIGAQTNFEYTKEETDAILAELAPVKPLHVRKRPELPVGVWKDTRGKTRNPYGTRHKNVSLGMYATPEEASDVYQKHIAKYNAKCEKAHMDMEIIRNKAGNAILHIRNKKKENVAAVIVDDNDWHNLMRCSFGVNKAGYVSIRLKGDIIMIHRYLLKPPDDMIVDHINGNKLDNRRCNLRIVDAKQSSYNKAKFNPTTASSPYKGVSKIVRKTTGNVYSVCIRKNGTVHRLGIFKNEEDAARAYNEKAQELFGEYAYLNVIPYVPPTKKQSDDVVSSDSEDDSDSDSDSEPEDDSWYLDFMSQF